MSAEEGKLQGWIPPLATEDEIREALDKAFGYRGDITITLKDGSTVEGYVFDRRCSGAALADCCVRVLSKNDGSRLKIWYRDISGLVFSGRDAAEGKSFELWVRRHNESRARNPHPETK